MFGIFFNAGIFVAFLVYFSIFGLFYQEKSGNPVMKHSVSKELLRLFRVTSYQASRDGSNQHPTLFAYQNFEADKSRQNVFKLNHRGI
jgi:hypothetical protein